MPRPAAAWAVAAVVLVAAALAPVHAQVAQPEGPAAIGIRSQDEEDLFKQVVQALATASEAFVKNKTIPEGMVVAASEPRNLTVAKLSRAIGLVLAAASLDTEAARTLGAPKYY